MSNYPDGMRWDALGDTPEQIALEEAFAAMDREVEPLLRGVRGLVDAVLSGPGSEKHKRATLQLVWQAFEHSDHFNDLLGLHDEWSHPDYERPRHQAQEEMDAAAFAHDEFVIWETLDCQSPSKSA